MMDIKRDITSIDASSSYTIDLNADSCNFDRMLLDNENNHNVNKNEYQYENDEKREHGLFSKYVKSSIFQKIFLMRSNMISRSPGAKTSNAASKTLQSVVEDEIPNHVLMSDQNYRDSFLNPKGLGRSIKRSFIGKGKSSKSTKTYKHRRKEVNNANNESQFEVKRGINRSRGQMGGTKLARHLTNILHLSDVEERDQSSDPLKKSFSRSNTHHSITCNSSTSTLCQDTHLLLESFMSDFHNYDSKKLYSPSLHTSTTSIINDEESSHTYHDNSSRHPILGLVQTRSNFHSPPKSLLGEFDHENDNEEPHPFPSRHNVSTENDMKETDPNVTHTHDLINEKEHDTTLIGNLTPTNTPKNDSVKRLKTSSTGGRKSRSLGLHDSDSLIKSLFNIEMSKRRCDHVMDKEEGFKTAMRCFAQKKYEEAQSHFESTLRMRLMLFGPFSLEVATVHEHIGECIYHILMDGLNHDNAETTDELYLSSIWDMIFHYMAALRALRAETRDNATITTQNDNTSATCKDSVEYITSDEISTESCTIYSYRTNQSDLSSQERQALLTTEEKEKRMIARVDKRLTEILFIQQSVDRDMPSTTK